MALTKLTSVDKSVAKKLLSELPIQVSTVAEMETKSYEVGQVVETVGYYAEGDAGAARYLVKAAQAFDGYGDHELANGNVAVLQFDEVLSASTFGAVKGISVDSKPALTAAFNYCRDNGLELLVKGQFRIDAPMTWNTSNGLNAQTIVRFENTRFTKNFNGIGLTCSGGASSHVHYGDLIIDKMFNLGDEDGLNATSGDYGFLQNSRIQRYGSLLIENQAAEGYVLKADTNMNGTELGRIRIRNCSGKGFTGFGTQDDNAVWSGNISVGSCYRAGIFIPDDFYARAWDMQMHAENCARNGTEDQLYTGGMDGCIITAYTEDNTGGTGVEVHIPATSSGVTIFSQRINKMLNLSSSSEIVQGANAYPVGTSATEGNVISQNLSNSVNATTTKNWVGSSTTDLVKRVVRGNGELSYEVTGRSGGDVMSVDMLPASGFTYRLQQNASDIWKILSGGMGRLLGSLVVGGTSSIEPSAVIEARSTTKGLLLPRMNTTQRDAIAAPADGLMVYNTTTDKINIRANGAWEAVTSV